MLDRPRYTTRRYVKHTQGTTDLTVTAPANEALVGPTVDVTGTAAPGNTVSVAVTNIDPGPPGDTVTETTVGAGGAFSVTVPTAGGTSVLNIAATSPSGGTARAVRTVSREFSPGTLLFEAADPLNDDNGPGNYAYPLSDNFKPGAYDLEAFQVFDAGDRIIFRVRTRDLTPTFGSPLGAQLVDVYVHVPGASSTSTAASFAQRNYEIAASGAWSRLIEVQGFGQRYVDAAGNTVGDVRISGNRTLALHHVQRDQGEPRHAGPGLGLQRRADRPGRLLAQTRRAASSRRRRTSSSASAPRRARTRTARSRPARCPRRWTSWCPPGRPRPTSSTTRSTHR